MFPASMGRPEYPTPVGTYTVLSKERSVVMDSSSVGIPVDAPDGDRYGGSRSPYHEPWPLRIFSSVGCQFTRVRECQPRLHQPEPRGCGMGLQHGQRWRPGDCAGKQHRSSSADWRLAVGPLRSCASPRKPVARTIVPSVPDTANGFGLRVSSADGQTTAKMAVRRVVGMGRYAVYVA